MLKSVDAIFIDFYGTISAGDREIVEQVCARVVEDCSLAVSAPEFAMRWGELFFAMLETCNRDGFRTLHECELASLRQVLGTFDRKIDPAPYVVDLEAYWADPPVYADALDFLARVSRPICCVSNADTAPLLSAIERHGFTFDAVVSSEDARCYKPGAGIFDRALAALNVSADQVVHIGDSLHSDIGGARQRGIQAVWLSRTSRIYDIGNARPDHSISLLTELSQLLDS